MIAITRIVFVMIVNMRMRKLMELYAGRAGSITKTAIVVQRKYQWKILVISVEKHTWYVIVDTQKMESTYVVRNVAVKDAGHIKISVFAIRNRIIKEILTIVKDVDHIKISAYVFVAENAIYTDETVFAVVNADSPTVIAKT